MKLDPSAKSAIADWLGEDVGRLPALLETLESTSTRARKLTAADVEPFLGEAGAVPPWDLTDAIDRGDAATALAMLAPDDAAPAAATRSWSWPRCTATTSGCCASTAPASTDRSGAASILKAAPFQARKALDQSRRLGHDGVARAIELLAAADLDLRGQRAWPPELVMEVLVARLARLTPKTRTTRR